MARIINKVLSLSILNKSNAEIQEMISVWSDALFGIVPESELDASLSKAIKDHTTTFPVNFYDLKNAHMQIEAEKTAERERFDAQPANRVARCSQKQHHITRDGRVKFMNPLNSIEEIEMPCPYCRPDAFHQQREKLLREHRELNQTEILNNLVDFKKVK